MITADELRELVDKVDVSHRHVCVKLGIPKDWFDKMIQNKIQNPNPKRMSLIKGFLLHYERMQQEYKRHTT